jgi:hypothetical protein
MATSVQYGTTAPGGTDPYPVETALATEVGKNSPQEAYNLLNMYGIQNMVGTDNYNASLQGQHDFARQQLAQQLYENNLKAAGEAVKTPGALSFYGSSPMYSGVLGGADPSMVGGIETNLRDMQRAEQAQKGGAGVASLTTAGFQPSSDQANVATAGLAGPQGTPTAITVAQLKLQGDLARAAARKSGDQMMTVPYKFGEDKAGNAIMGQVKVRAGASDQEIAAAAQNAGRVYSGFYPQGTGLPGATGPAAGGNVNAGPDQSRPPPPPRTQTSLPMAQQDTGRSGTAANTTTTRTAPTAQASSNKFILDAKTQQQAQAGLKVLPPDAKRDVAANIQGAVVPIVPLVGGGVGYVGKSGTIHTLPR